MNLWRVLNKDEVPLSCMQISVQRQLAVRVRGVPRWGRSISPQGPNTVMTATSFATEYDCLVLSGGGANGAYGAGVAKALDAYRNQKGIPRPICYTGPPPAR